jgi:hypothetical protein
MTFTTSHHSFFWIVPSSMGRTSTIVDAFTVFTCQIYCNATSNMTLHLQTS